MCGEKVNDFKEWLSRYLNKDSPYGDFARDTYALSSFPRRGKRTLEEHRADVRCAMGSAYFDSRIRGIFNYLWRRFEKQADEISAESEEA